MLDAWEVSEVSYSKKLTDLIHRCKCVYLWVLNRILMFNLIFLGASNGQRGFLGCMRALKINGVTFNLKEKAKVSPGVSPGCQGHCNSYGTHCRNGGKCVEQYSGFSCDCSLTAYDGPFCTEGNHTCACPTTTHINTIVA